MDEITATETSSVIKAESSKKSRLAATILAWKLGFFGAHNLYCGQWLLGFTRLILSIGSIVTFVIGYTKLILAFAALSSLSTYASQVGNDQFTKELLTNYQNALVSAGIIIGLSVLLILIFGVWSLVDAILATCGKLKDAEGKKITNWVNE